MKKIRTLLIFIKLSAAFLFLSSCSRNSSESFQAMNTLMTINSYGINSAKANRLARLKIAEIESLISTTKSDSEVSLFNNSETKTFTFSPVTSALLDFSLQMAVKTDGALNPCLYPVTKAWGFTTEQFRIPPQSEINSLLKLTDYKMLKLNSSDGQTGALTVFLADSSPETSGIQLDFGATGKGFAGDEAIKVLKTCGIDSAILDLGGNVQVLGGKKTSDGSFSDWNIGVKSPWGGSPAGGLKVKNKAVITSGGYQRYFEDENGKRYIHIMNGKTGRPAEPDAASVTIVSDTGIYGDALSTALFVMGKEKAIEFWRTYNDFEMIIIIDQDSIAFTEGLKDSFRLLHPFKNVQIINR